VLWFVLALFCAFSLATSDALVKRFSLLIRVDHGHLLFGEEGLAERLLGASLMVAGVALILIGGGA
jgi:hypothetical protein